MAIDLKSSGSSGSRERMQKLVDTIRKPRSERLSEKSDRLYEKDKELKKEMTKRQEEGKDLKRVMKKRNRTQEREQKAFVKSSQAETREKKRAGEDVKGVIKDNKRKTVSYEKEGTHTKKTTTNKKTGKIVEKHKYNQDKVKISKKAGKDNSTKVKFKTKSKHKGIISHKNKSKGSATYKDIKPSEMKTGDNYRDKRDEDSVKGKSSVKFKMDGKTITSTKKKNGEQTKASIAREKRRTKRQKNQEKKK